MRGNVKVSASLWNTSTGSISSATYDLTEEFVPYALIPYNVPGEVDRLYFFMESPTVSSWFEISELELSYGPRKIKEIFVGVDDGTGKSVARKASLAYIGINGVAEEFWNVTE